MKTKHPIPCQKPFPTADTHPTNSKCAVSLPDPFPGQAAFPFPEHSGPVCGPPPVLHHLPETAQQPAEQCITHKPGKPPHPSPPAHSPLLLTSQPKKIQKQNIPSRNPKNYTKPKTNTRHFGKILTCPSPLDPLPGGPGSPCLGSAEKRAAVCPGLERNHSVPQGRRLRLE